MQRDGGLSRGVIAVAAVPLLATTAYCAGRLVQGDVHYALGGLETGSRGGFALSDIFIARPYVYAVALDGLSRFGDAVTGHDPSAGYELAIRIAASVVVALIGLLLYSGLRRYVSSTVAGTTATFITAATIVTPAWTFLQPDWLGVVCSVFVLAAALAFKRAPIAVILGGIGVGLTVAVKLATAPWALMALVVIALFSWRRAIGTAIAGAIASIVWMEWTKHFQPKAWMWLQDQVTLVADSPLNHAPRLHDYTELAKASLNAALVNPIILIAPAAAIALVLAAAPGRQRLIALLAAIALAGLSIGSPFGQGEWFMYHFAGTPVAAAGAVGAAIGMSPRSRIVLIPGSLVATVASVILMAQPTQWRLTHATVTGLIVTVIALAACVAVVLVARSPQRETRGAAGGMVAGSIALSAALLAPNLPFSHFAFDGYNRQIEVGNSSAAAVDRSLANAAVLRKQLGGADTPVLYLTYGAFNYYLGNPSICPYPSPQWVQRAARPAAAALPSFRDNLKCIQDPGAAKFALIDTHWFRLKALPAEVQSAMAQHFDCALTGRAFRSDGVLVCPRTS